MRFLPGSIRYHMGLSSSSSYIYNLYSQDIEKFLELIDLKIVEGSIPSENSKEILISDRFAKQNKLNIGDILSRKNINVRINGEYKVSGIYTGDMILAVINDNINDLEREDAYYANIIYKSKDESYLDVGNLVNKEKFYVHDYKSGKIEMDNSMKALNLFTDNLNIFMIIILCITLGNLNSIVLKKRVNEVSILEAIGYKKRTIMFKLWKENFIACALGYILGIIITTMAVFIINVLIFEKQGAEFLLFSRRGMLNAITIPIFISIFTLIPALRLKSKI